MTSMRSPLCAAAVDGQRDADLHPSAAHAERHRRDLGRAADRRQAQRALHRSGRGLHPDRRRVGGADLRRGRNRLADRASAAPGEVVLAAACRRDGTLDDCATGRPARAAAFERRVHRGRSPYRRELPAQPGSSERGLASESASGWAWGWATARGSTARRGPRCRGTCRTRPTSSACRRPRRSRCRPRCSRAPCSRSGSATPSTPRRPACRSSPLPRSHRRAAIPEGSASSSSGCGSSCRSSTAGTPSRQRPCRVASHGRTRWRDRRRSAPGSGRVQTYCVIWATVSAAPDLAAGDAVEAVELRAEVAANDDCGMKRTAARTLVAMAARTNCRRARAH